MFLLMESKQNRKTVEVLLTIFLKHNLKYSDTINNLTIVKRMFLIKIILLFLNNTVIITNFISINLFLKSEFIFYF